MPKKMLICCAKYAAHGRIFAGKDSHSQHNWDNMQEHKGNFSDRPITYSTLRSVQEIKYK